MRADPDSPFVGLDFYSEEHAELFFGRDTERKRLIGNLRATRFTVLYAESGVGKSSLLRAGVVARLRELARRSAAERGSLRYVPVIFSTWRENPIEPLIDAIEEAVRLLREDASFEISRESLDGAIESATEFADAAVLLVLDQFEEFFLYADEEAQSAFADRLARCVTQSDLRCNFLISIREDAYARLGDLFKGKIPNVYGNYLHLEHLDVRAARAAIVEPIKHFKRLRSDLRDADIEDELVYAVLDQVGRGKVTIGEAPLREATGDSAATDAEVVEAPYLQLVLDTLWKEELGAGSHILRLSTLERLGGAKMIVQAHLEKAMAALPASRQKAAAAAFFYMVSERGRKIALSAAEVARFTELPEDLIQPTLEQLSEGKVRILRPVEGSDEFETTRYEIFHDVLAGAVLAWRAEYVQAEKDRALHGRLEQEEKERRAAEESERIARRRARIFRAVAAIAFAFAIVAAIALIVAYHASKRSTSEKYAAESISALSLDPVKSTQLAVKALDAAWTPQADRALRLALPDLRLRRVLRAADALNGASFSSDGRYVITASDDKTARVWTAGTGQPAGKPLVADAEVLDAAFSPDGAYVAAISADWVLHIWDWRRGRSRWSLPDRLGSSVAFSRDGRYIVSSTSDNRVRIWDLRDGEFQSPVVLGRKSDQYVVQRAAFSPANARYVVGASSNGTAYVWDWKRKQVLAELDRHSGPVYSAAFSPDGNYVVTGSRDKHARVFSWRQGRHGHVVKDLVGHSDAVSDANFSPDGRLLVTASVDGTARVWEWGSQEAAELAVLRGHAADLRSATFSPDGRWILTASADKTARLWLWRGSQEEDFRPGGTRTVGTASFGGGDSYIVGTSFLDHKVWIWNARTGRLTDSFTVPTGLKSDGPYDAEFSPNGNLIVTADGGSTVRVRPVINGRVVRHAAQDLQNRYVVVRARFSGDGRRIVTSVANGTVVIWVRHGQRWKKEHTLKVGKRGVTDAVFSPDDSEVLTADLDHTAAIWDASTGRKLRTLQGHLGPVTSAAFSPDGKLVATASIDSTARIWDASSGRQLRELSGPSFAAAFSKDGKWVFTGGTDGITRVWDWRSGQVEAVFRRHAGFINSLVPTQDGKRILTASDDGTARLYQCDRCVPIDQLLSQARQQLKALTPTVAPPPTTKTTAPATVDLPGKSCGADLHANENTSCPFAQNVRDSYHVAGSDTVEAYSPVTGKTYQMTCSTEDYTTCSGGSNAKVYFP